MALKLPSRLALLFLAAGLAPLAVTLLVLVPRGQDALRTSAQLLHQAQVDSLRARIGNGGSRVEIRTVSGQIDVGPAASSQR